MRSGEEEGAEECGGNSGGTRDPGYWLGCPAVLASPIEYLARSNGRLQVRKLLSTN